MRSSLNKADSEFQLPEFRAIRVHTVGTPDSGRTNWLSDAFFSQIPAQVDSGLDSQPSHFLTPPKFLLLEYVRGTHATLSAPVFDVSFISGGLVFFAKFKVFGIACSSYYERLRRP